MLEHERQRAEDLQLRLADAITRFAGSMPFVWAHAGAFAVWMLWLESPPWPSLTLVVSLEAIFLSTFVLIGQNRQAAFARAKADHDFAAQEEELRVNTELTRALYLRLGLPEEPAPTSSASSAPLADRSAGGPSGNAGHRDQGTAALATFDPRSDSAGRRASVQRPTDGAAPGEEPPPSTGGSS